MRIGIDFQPLDPTTGTGRATTSFLLSLQGRVGEGGVALLETFVSGRRDQRPAWMPASMGYRRLRLPGRVQAWLNERLGVPVERLFRLRQPDLIHTLRSKWVYSRLPLVATILDVSWRHFAGRYQAVVGDAFVRSAERLIRDADHLHAISRATADDLIAGGVPPGRVTVAHLGVDRRFREVPEGEARRVRARYHLPEEFLLYVGALNVRKNFAVLPAAAGQLSKPVPVVAAGPPPAEGLPHWGFQPGRDLHLGYLPDEDLPGLYTAARALVFPSLLEGFGFPLLEAMAVGTPVIASDIAVFREVGQDAPWYFPPDQPGLLAKAIDAVVRHEDLRCQMSSRGQQRARAFGWDDCVDGVMECYRKALRR